MPMPVHQLRWHHPFLDRMNSRSAAHLTLQLRSGSGIKTNNCGVDPAPDRALTTTEQTGGPAQYPGQALVTTPAKPPYQGDHSQHTLRKEVANVHTKNSPLTKQ